MERVEKMGFMQQSNFNKSKNLIIVFTYYYCLQERSLHLLYQIIQSISKKAYLLENIIPKHEQAILLT